MGHGLHGWGDLDHREREIEDTWNNRDMGVGSKREDHFSSKFEEEEEDFCFT